ncbi:MAG: glycoside hydrolase, partial [Sphingobacteriales bacterium]|nr:glycoside hydrolase [Sphingobacteriales bacterium]
VLDSSAVKMSVSALRKLNALVKAGATVAGVKPTASPSLADDVNEFNKLVSEIWSSSNSKVTAGKSLSDVLNVAADFSYTKPQSNTNLLYVHRKTNDRDIYWINSRTTNVEDLEATFRITGKVPELWFAETGKTEPLSYTIANGVTKVKLHLEPNDAVFVVFKNKATKNSVELPAVKVSDVAAVNGGEISFQPNRGAPVSITVNELSSWSTNADAGVKYFSGTATYTKTINASADWFAKDAELWLNLGDVKNLAEVIVNGKSLGILWKKPFRVSISGALKPGNNKLEIKVTNLWVNRLIGDAQPNVTNKITYTTMPFYQANSPLLPSGLLGPVKLTSVNRK